MKKIFVTMATLCGICAGAHSFQMTSAFAQTGMITTTIIPLTNQAPFMNTVVQATNLTSTQLSNVVTLLLNLQTNIEETIPVLDLIQSNAVVVSVAPSNGLRGVVLPLTNANGLAPTGAATGRPQTSLAVKIGTNTFGIDVPTLQALFILRDNLQQALVVLQGLNGTTPPPTNSPASSRFFIPPPITNAPSPITNLPPAVTNFSPGPLTNTLTIPPGRPPAGAAGSLAPF